MNRAASALAAGLMSLIAVVATSFAGVRPAYAAPLGAVKLSQSSGTVDATPIFTRATASRPCPKGYGRNALVRVGRPGGPFTNLAKPLFAGGYDKSAVTAQPNRSFALALGGVAPGQGEWLVVVECYSETLGQHPERFATTITVSGRTWRVGRAGAAKPGTNASGTPQPTPTASAAVPPAAGAGSPTPGATSADPKLASTSSRSGSASPIAGVWWVVGVVLVLFIVGIVWLATRRSPGPAPRRRP